MLKAILPMFYRENILMLDRNSDMLKLIVAGSVIKLL